MFVLCVIEDEGDTDIICLYCVIEDEGDTDVICLYCVLLRTRGILI